MPFELPIRTPGFQCRWTCGRCKGGGHLVRADSPVLPTLEQAEAWRAEFLEGMELACKFNKNRVMPDVKIVDLSAPETIMGDDE